MLGVPPFLNGSEGARRAEEAPFPIPRASSDGGNPGGTERESRPGLSGSGSEGGEEPEGSGLSWELFLKFRAPRSGRDRGTCVAEPREPSNRSQEGHAMQTTDRDDCAAEEGRTAVDADACDGYELWQDIGGSD